MHSIGQFAYICNGATGANLNSETLKSDQFAGLVAHNLGDLRVGMAKRGDCNTSGKIDVLFTIHIIEQLGVGASGNHQIVRPCISGHLEGLFVDEVR